MSIVRRVVIPLVAVLVVGGFGWAAATLFERHRDLEWSLDLLDTTLFERHRNLEGRLDAAIADWKRAHSLPEADGWENLPPASRPKEVVATRLLVIDALGRTRAEIATGKNGASFSLYDDNGNARSTMGAVTLEGGDGQKTEKSESSIHLFRSNGDLIWSAP